MITSTLQLAIRPFARSLILSVEKLTVLPCVKSIDARNIHITSNCMKTLSSRGSKLNIQPRKTVVVEGEYSTDLFAQTDSFPLFPDINTANKIYDNIPYNMLHIINIKVTRNNTIMSLTDYKGKGILLHSAGTEGFKNTKKGTNVAAQQVATVIGLRSQENGVKTVRVRIQGIGAGRMGSLKGLQNSGINIVSITDDTRVSWNPPRPRKVRRI